MSDTNESPKDSNAQPLKYVAKQKEKDNRRWFKKKRFWVLGFFLVTLAAPNIFPGLVEVEETSPNAGSTKVSAEAAAEADASAAEADASAAEADAAAAEAEAKAAAEAAKIIKVSAKELLSQLDANALAAKTKWNGKNVRITGTLDNIDASGDYFSVKGDSGFEIIDVQVFIDDSFIPAVSAFKKGQSVTVTGEITDVGELLGYQVKAISIP